MPTISTAPTASAPYLLQSKRRQLPSEPPNSQAQATPTTRTLRGTLSTLPINSLYLNALIGIVEDTFVIEKVDYSVGLALNARSRFFVGYAGFASDLAYDAAVVGTAEKSFWRSTLSRPRCDYRRRNIYTSIAFFRVNFTETVMNLRVIAILSRILVASHQFPIYYGHGPQGWLLAKAFEKMKNFVFIDGTHGTHGAAVLPIVLVLLMSDTA